MTSLTNALWNYIEKIIHAILSFLFGLTGRKLPEETFSAYMQFVRFVIVGVSNSVIYYIVYVIALVIIKNLQIFGIYSYLPAQIIAFILSVLWSFYWNNKLVFTRNTEKKRSVWKVLLKTFAAYSFTGLFLNNIMMLLWVNVLGISEYVAPFINLLINVPINYIINKFWAFNDK